MELKPLENPWVKKIRLMSVYLVTSVSINIFLITAVAYFSLSKRQEGQVKGIPRYEVTTTNAKVLNHYFELKFDALVDELADKTLLQDGYTKRDLALACLVNYHFFDIEKAVSGTLLQRRRMTFVHKEGGAPASRDDVRGTSASGEGCMADRGGGEIFDVMVFPGLEDKDYQVINAFIQHHRHPLTAEGLFHELQKKREEPTLAEAFYGTTEFYAVFYALNHGEAKISREKLLGMLLEGNWTAIANFRINQNLHDFLTEYVKMGSGEAASVWITFEEEYLLRQLGDEQLVSLISVIRDNSLPTQLFLKKVLCSVRSDYVRKSAGVKLYNFEGIIPNEYDQTEAMKKFLPTLFKEKEVANAPRAPEPKKETKKGAKSHTVQTGDSLWKIAKKYGVTIDSLRNANDLESDQLKPGQVLKVNLPHPDATDDT